MRFVNTFKMDTKIDFDDKSFITDKNFQFKKFEF